jgi:hypothetical protein
MLDRVKNLVGVLDELDDNEEEQDNV